MTYSDKKIDGSSQRDTENERIMCERYTVPNIISGIWYYPDVLLLILYVCHHNDDSITTTIQQSEAPFVINTFHQWFDGHLCTASSSKWPCWTCYMYVFMWLFSRYVCMLHHWQFEDLPIWGSHWTIPSKQGSESSANFFLPMLQAATCFFLWWLVGEFPYSGRTLGCS